MRSYTGAERHGRGPDIAQLMRSIPYVMHLGITARQRGNRIILEMPFGEQLVGNPVLPALHGGVVGSLLETAAMIAVVRESGSTRLPQIVSVTIDYLRSGRAAASFASARITHLRRRIAKVHAEMWQDDEARPIATLEGHFLIERNGAPSTSREP